MCHAENSIYVGQGSLAMNYNYSVNDSEQSAMSINAAQGQCIKL
jgi:hypothetical protein